MPIKSTIKKVKKIVRKIGKNVRKRVFGAKRTTGRRVSKTGRKLSNAHKQAISKALKGKKKSTAHKKAISDGLKRHHSGKKTNAGMVKKYNRYALKNLTTEKRRIGKRFNPHGYQAGFGKIH